MTKTEEVRFLYDPYMEWAKGEGVPVVEDFGIDLIKVETKSWARFGTHGAIAHLKGRGDFISIFILEIKPGGKSEPQQHLFEEVVYVLEGHGSTTIETYDGRTHSFEWGPQSLFALPLNAKYQHFNASGREPARLSSTTSLCIMLNVFHNEEFIFNNPHRFPEREGAENAFSGEGNFIPKKPGRHMWETNFIPDLGTFKLRKWSKRGAGSSNMMFVLADGSMHSHMSEMPVGTYKKAHRHGADFHVFCVTGTGYSLLWYDEKDDYVRVDWQHGMVFAPPDGMYHQHFNTSTDPARYLAIAFGGIRYPTTEAKRRLFAGVDVSVRDGGAQVEYEHQSPRIHKIYLDELAKKGGASKMGEVIDEAPFLKKLKKSA